MREYNKLDTINLVTAEVISWCFWELGRYFFLASNISSILWWPDGVALVDFGGLGLALAAGESSLYFTGWWLLRWQYKLDVPLSFVLTLVLHRSHVTQSLLFISAIEKTAHTGDRFLKAGACIGGASGSTTAMSSSSASIYNELLILGPIKVRRHPHDLFSIIIPPE